MKHDMSRLFGFNKQTIHSEWVPRDKVKSKELVNGQWVVETTDGQTFTGERIQELSNFILVKTIHIT